MLKVMAIIAVLLVVPISAIAADKATPEARLKQMEDLGSAKSRIFYKLEDIRRAMVVGQRTVGLRFNLVSEKYQKARAAINVKISAENAKPLKDQATLDAATAKLQAIDDTWNKILAPAWNNFNTNYQVLYQLVYGMLQSVAGMTGYDDYVNKADCDLQPLLNLVLAIEVKTDATRVKVSEWTSEIGKAMDEVDVVCKE